MTSRTRLAAWARTTPGALVHYEGSPPDVAAIDTEWHGAAQATFGEVTIRVVAGPNHDIESLAARLIARLTEAGVVVA